MIEERQPLRAHKISLSNRSLGVITGVKDVVSFDLNEIIWLILLYLLTIIIVNYYNDLSTSGKNFIRPTA